MICNPQKKLALCDEVIASETYRMVWARQHFSFRRRDNSISAVAEGPERATCAGTHRQPEMQFECLACNCTLRAAHSFGKPENDFTPVRRHTCGQIIKNVHDKPR
jgi:hypothetical protein